MWPLSKNLNSGILQHMNYLVYKIFKSLVSLIFNGWTIDSVKNLEINDKCFKYGTIK